MHMRSPIISVASCLLAGALLLPAGTAGAHWCNNIWAAPSRIVVKPEVTSINVDAGGTKLRIYIQNNLPYALFAVELRGNASGYSVSVEPSEQDIAPGQNRAFTFTINGSAGARSAWKT